MGPWWGVRNQAGRWGRTALLGASLFTHISFAAGPEIESCAPLALRPGVPVKVTFSGQNFPTAPRLWTSFPAQVETLDAGSDTKARFRITAATEAAVGIGAVRLYGSNGVSNLELVMLDDLPGISESKTNQTRTNAQSLAVGQAVDGTGQELGYDWFKLRLSSGQRVSAEVVATRLGSKLDSVLRVFDSDGRQIAQNDDAVGLLGDSFIRFTAPRAGDYFIELRDVNYGGGPEFFYRLRLGDYALATTAFPLAVAANEKPAVELAGPGGVVGKVSMAAPTHAPTVLPVAVKGRTGSTFARVIASEGDAVTERKRKSATKEATKISVPGGISGRFDQAGERDHYEFTARQGERWEFRATTRSLGSPCDAVLELQTADGAQLARSNPSAPDEGVVTYKFATNGTYRLVVEEATGAFGANCVYHLAVGPAAGFALTLDTDRVNAALGGSFDLKVICQRGDFKGSITLGLEGMPGGFTLTNHVIAEGKTNVTLKVTLPKTVGPTTLSYFQVIGSAQRDGKEVQVQAKTTPALRRQFPTMLYPPTEFDGPVAMGIIEQKKN